MKKNLFIPLVMLMFFGFASCSSSGEDEDLSLGNYAMKVTINGEVYEMNNALGTKKASNSINTNYPNDKFIYLQGTLLPKEVNMWINREHLVVGKTIEINRESVDNDTYIKYIDLLDDDLQVTVSGSITITLVDSDKKVVKGTFELDVENYDSPGIIAHRLRDGSFAYTFE
ncbi:hypothetical protein [Tenacibaculum ascidiaceicola]|uniref:hypothetical protein n=1 Tax=Tenacibaculum ascidiaceicola TaxID=1699411 RepID=UPI003894B787